MDNVKRLEFFKNRIKEKLESIKSDIPEIRYKLWVASVDACDNYEELREMAELDMQLDMFEYTKTEINPKLEKLNMGIEELREGKGISSRHNKDNQTDFNLKVMDNGPIEEYTPEEMLEDMNDPEIDAAMAYILMNRILTEPMEETHREDILDAINEEKPSIDDIDTISDEDMEGLGNIGESVELSDDDFDITEEELLGTEERVSKKSAEESLFDDFSDIKTDVIEQKDKESSKEEEIDPFDISDEDLASELGTDEEDVDENEDPFDIDEEDIPNEDEEALKNDDETDPFDISDEDLENELGEDEEDEDGTDPFDISDEDFGDLGDDEEDEDDTLEVSDEDFGDLGEDEEDEESQEDIFDTDMTDIDEEDEEGNPFSNTDEDEASFDELINAGDIFDSSSDDDLEDELETDDEDNQDDEESGNDDIFSSLDDDEFGEEDTDNEEDTDSEDEDDAFGDLSGLEDFVAEDDIEIEDDTDKFFEKSSKQVKKVEEKKQPKEIKAETLFKNGTDRGQKTQEMFTSITKIGSLFSKMSSQAAKQTKKVVNTGIAKASASSMFDLKSNSADEEIEGF